MVAGAGPSSTVPPEVDVQVARAHGRWIKRVISLVADLGCLRAVHSPWSVHPCALIHRYRNMGRNHAERSVRGFPLCVAAVQLAGAPHHDGGGVCVWSGPAQAVRHSRPHASSLITGDVPGRLPPDHTVVVWLRLSRREEAWRITKKSRSWPSGSCCSGGSRAARKLNWADRALLAILFGVIPKARRRGLRLLPVPGPVITS